MKRHFLLLGLGALAGILLLFFFLEGEHTDGVLNAWMLLAAMIYGVALSYSVYGFSRQLDRWVAWQQQAGWRWLLGLAGNTLLAYSLTYLAVQTYSWWQMKVPLSFASAPQLFYKLGILLFLLVLLYTVLYFALYSYQYFGQLRLAHLQQEREQIDLQWSALRNQLQPHFLFNSLNTISALIYRDPQQAETFIRRLAQTYRYPLQNYDQVLVSLDEELGFVEAYHYLLQTRFGDHLRLTIDVPSAARQTKVPPLSLQLLLENAVKHNIVSAEEQLEVQLTADEEWLWMSNNRTTSPEKVDSFSIGLNNIKARYRLLSKRKVEVKKGIRFMVKIPLLR